MKWIPRILVISPLLCHLLIPCLNEQMAYVARLWMCLCLGALISITWTQSENL